MLLLVIRHLKKIIIVALLTLLLAYLASQKLSQPYYQAESFFTVTFAEAVPQPYSTTQYADWFTETVMGWIGTTDFQEQFREALQAEDLEFASPRVKKSTRLNLTVNFRVADEETGLKTAQAFNQVLAAEVSSFNKISRSVLVLANPRVSVAQIVPDLRAIYLVAFLIGLILGIAFSYLYERLRGRISFTAEAEELFQSEALELMCHRESITKLNNFWIAMSQRVVILDVSTERNLWKKISAVPKNSDLVLVIRLGEVRMLDLQKIWRAYPRRVDLVLVN